MSPCVSWDGKMKQTRSELGQMFLVGFDGLKITAEHPIVEAIERDHLGGVILFDRNVDGSRQNIRSPEQLRTLTGDLRKYGGESLLIAVDQEGGKVCRLKERDGFPPTRSAAELAAAGNDNLLSVQAAAIAETLDQYGINFNLAPVVDLNLNPDNPIIGRYDRSYGQETDQVVDAAVRFITAHQRQGIACCIKHFPGHGSARGDSHLGFVDITGCWQERELEPFARLIASGLADSVMTAHVVHRELDQQARPATLSPVIIQELLRGRLGFEGVVVSDDLQMKAISNEWRYEEAVQQAVLAGVDLIIVGNNMVRERNATARGIKAITELIKSGRLDGRAVDASLERIALLKQKITGGKSWQNSQPTT